MDEVPCAVDCRHRLYIVRRVSHAVSDTTVAYFKNHAEGVSSILQMVGKPFGGEARNHPRSQLHAFITSEQGRMTLQDIDKFVL